MKIAGLFSGEYPWVFLTIGWQEGHFLSSGTNNVETWTDNFESDKGSFSVCSICLRSASASVTSSSPRWQYHRRAYAACADTDHRRSRDSHRDPVAAMRWDCPSFRAGP